MLYKKDDHNHGEGCGCTPEFFTDMIDNAATELSRRNFLKQAGIFGGMMAFAPLGSELLAAEFTMPNDAKADAIYHGGTIITMKSENDRVEALAVHKGHILATGTLQEMKKFQDKRTKMIDLKGKTLMPGFIDPHSHLAIQSIKFSVANLDPKPIGEAGSIADIQQIMKDWIKTQKIKPGEWAIGWGYDDTGIEEHRHPTKEDLDLVSTEHPILLVHISSHLMTGNSKMLEMVGLSKDTPDPKGGKIRRMPNANEPNGVLEETAMFLALAKTPEPTVEETMDLFEEGMRRYAAAGITTAQDCATFPGTWELFVQMHKDGRMPIDVITWPLYKTIDEKIFQNIVNNHGKVGRIKMGGVKMIIDGSIQGYTAYLSKPYYEQPQDADPLMDQCDTTEAECLRDHDAKQFAQEQVVLNTEKRGYPSMTVDDVTEWIKKCDAHGIQLQAHTNGDGATDILLESVQKARLGKINDRRTTIIHAQTMREDQLDDAKQFGLTPSFFPIHNYFWGDRHREIFLGPDRAARINPANSALKRNLPFTLHHDAPVAGIDMLKVAWSAVNRVTTSGKVLGKEQKISPYEAFKAITYSAAWQNFEEDRKGTLEVGKLADMVVLDADPLAIDPMKIKYIGIVETIKEGKSIFRT